MRDAQGNVVSKQLFFCNDVACEDVCVRAREYAFLRACASVSLPIFYQSELFYCASLNF